MYDHIVLISIDTLRSDGIAANPLRLWQHNYPHLGAPSTPILDDLVGSRAFFANCISAAPYTSSAHSTILSSKWPLQAEQGSGGEFSVECLVTEPVVMLLDEPLSALDAVTRVGVRGELSALIRRIGCAVVLVTHDLGEATELADRIVLMGGVPGQIISDHQVDDDDHAGQVESLYDLLQRQRLSDAEQAPSTGSR